MVDYKVEKHAVPDMRTVVFPDGSRLAVLPGVLDQAGINAEPSIPEPARRPGKMAQALPELPSKVGDWGVAGGTGEAQKGLENPWTAPPEKPPERVTVPAVGARGGPAPFDPRAAAQERTGQTDPSTTVEAAVEAGKRLATKPAIPATPGGKRRPSKAEVVGPSPESFQIVEGALGAVGEAREGTDEALKAKGEQEARDKANLSMMLQEQAEQARDRQADRQGALQAGRDAFKRKSALMDARLKNLREEPSAREKVMGNRGWFGEILAALQMAIGSASEAVTGVNPVKEALDRQIRDEEQRMARQLELYGKSENRMTELRQELADDEAARMQNELEIMEVQNARLRAFAASTESEQVKLQIAVTLAQRQEEMAQLGLALRERMATKIAQEYKWTQGTPGRPASVDYGKALEYAGQILNLGAKGKEVAGVPSATAADQRAREESGRARFLATEQLGLPRLWYRGADPAEQRALNESIANRAETRAIFKQIRDLATIDAAEDPEILKRMTRLAREARRVAGIQRKEGDYGAPTGNDWAMIEKDLGELGDNPGKFLVSRTAGTFFANIDELERIWDRRLKSRLRTQSSLDPNDVMLPDLPLEDEGPPQ